MAEAVVILAPGFEEVEAITPIDYLRRAKIKVTVVGIGGETVVGNHQIPVQADVTIGRYQGRPDAVVVPGGMPGAQNIADNEHANRLIREVHERGGVVAALCAAPAVVLEPLGILAGKQFTCYPGFEDRATSGKHRSEAVVIDGQLVTARAVGSAGHFAKAIVAKVLGTAAAEELAKKTFLE